MPTKDKMFKGLIQIGKRYQGLRYLMLAVIACVLAVYYGGRELKRIIGDRQMPRRFAAAMLCAMLVFTECAPAAYAATGEEAGVAVVPTENAEPYSGEEPEEDVAPDESTSKNGETEDEEILEENPEEIPQETLEEISENLRSLQEQINALPTGEEYRNMSAEEQDAVYEMAASVSDAYFELSEEDQAKLDITRLEELFAVMNEGVATYGTTMPGARSEYNSSTGDVFLGGNYIEVGISKHGSFGTSTLPKTKQNWHPHSSASGLGLTSDGDGWDVGESPVTGDFFLPGSPEERWGLAYKLDGTTYQYLVADRNSTFSGTWSIEPTVQDASDISNGMLKAIVTGKTTHGVEITITYSFGVNDKFYTTAAEIVNNSGKEITEVRFMRSFDPDQDQQTQGTFNTYNKVICNPASDKAGGGKNFAMVVARGEKTMAGFFFVAFDNRARASRGVNFNPSNLYLDGLWNSAPVTALTYADDNDVVLTSEKYSLQGTTQGRYLTGGVPPVRFSM